MKKITLILLILGTVTMAANVGLQYEYKSSSNLIGIAIETNSKYAVTLNGKFELSKYHYSIGGEVSNSFKLLNRGKFYAAIIVDLGAITDYTKQYSQTSNANILLSKYKTTLYNLDILYGMYYQPAEIFSVFVKIGIGTKYSQQAKFGVGIIPAIGLKILLPKKNK